MKFKVLLITLILITSIGYSHDIKMAVFEISEANHGLTLSISLDRLDFEKSLLTSYANLDLSNDEEREFYISEYISGNIGIHINNECVTIEIDQISYDPEYIRVTATLNCDPDKINDLLVYNSCLIDYNEGHLNIVKAHLYGRTRTFKLSKDRLKTTISY